MKIVALAGGVGGAKLADGLAQVLSGDDLTIIVNTGDDFEHLGLLICPDLDTVCYTLAGIANKETGWGRADETWHAMESLSVLGGPVWFRLGDRDLGVHLERTRRLKSGACLSEVTRDFSQAWGIGATIIPMSDQLVRTFVSTEEGVMQFQEYFVLHACKPRVRDFRFHGVEEARPAPGVMKALGQADLVVICPSNPWVSIDPILAVPGIRDRLKSKPAIAVSPIIAGKAIKGPAAKMYTELGIEPSALAVAKHYNSASNGGLLDGFVIDTADSELSDCLRAMDLHVMITGTVMKTSADRANLARDVLSFGERMIEPSSKPVRPPRI